MPLLLFTVIAASPAFERLVDRVDAKTEANDVRALVQTELSNARNAHTIAQNQTCAEHLLRLAESGQLRCGNNGECAA